MNDDDTKKVIDEPQAEDVDATADTETADESADVAKEAEADADPEEKVEEPVNSPLAADDSESTEQDGEATSTEPTDVADISDSSDQNPNARWYVVHTYSGHENKVATQLKQRVESEHLEHKIIDVLVPTQDRIEIRGGKKEQVKEKIFPGYILVKMELDDGTWLAVRTTQGVTSFVGIGNKPTPIPDFEVKTIVKFMTQGAPATFKDVFLEGDTVKIADGPFSEFIGKVDSVDKERGKVRVLVSIFGRETPVELDFLQVQKL